MNILTNQNEVNIDVIFSTPLYFEISGNSTYYNKHVQYVQKCKIGMPMFASHRNQQNACNLVAIFVHKQAPPFLNFTLKNRNFL